MYTKSNIFTYCKRNVIYPWVLAHGYVVWPMKATDPGYEACFCGPLVLNPQYYHRYAATHSPFPLGSWLSWQYTIIRLGELVNWAISIERDFLVPRDSTTAHFSNNRCLAMIMCHSHGALHPAVFGWCISVTPLQVENAAISVLYRINVKRIKHLPKTLCCNQNWTYRCVGDTALCRGQVQSANRWQTSWSTWDSCSCKTNSSPLHLQSTTSSSSLATSLLLPLHRELNVYRLQTLLVS